MLRLDEERAIELIRKLLKGHEDKWPALLEDVRKIATAAGPLGEEGRRRLTQLEKLVASGPSVKQTRRKPVKAGRKAKVTK
jgi:hypothetical protein